MDSKVMLVFIIAGAVMLALGVIIEVLCGLKAKKCISSAAASVMMIREKTNKQGTKTKYIPVFEYTVGGTKYSGKLPAAKSKDKHKVGDKVDIFFDPVKPKNYRLKRDLRAQAIGAAAIVLGLVIAVVIPVLMNGAK